MKISTMLATSLVLITGSTVEAATHITTPEIVVASANVSCLDYKVVGACVWLDCGPTGCAVTVTPKICHYLPDVVVSSYHRSDDNPWTEMSFLSSAARGIGSGLMGVEIDGGTRSESQGRQENKGMPTKEVSVIGNPVAALPTATFGYLCPSKATSFQPYFLSQADAWSWRTGLTEMLYPQTWLPGQREIGTWPLSTWGAVYPRIGTVIQTEEPKAAAVLAQRAIDIVTRTGQLHVYLPLAGDPSNEQFDHWQMLVPTVQDHCETFGSNNPLWTTGKMAEDGGYAWNYWRKYQCCIPNPGTLIAETGDCPDTPLKE